ncbi:MAG: adenylate/guanylate cyclase domain-containing protein [Verrucomicrobia bacterium]|nr:adenylate/guanylate cyclase domain-containing protein [Verrucomicrobiota bacterium]
MKPNAIKATPFLITLAVIVIVALAHWGSRTLEVFNGLRRLEWMTYDWRARAAFRHPAPVATNLAAVFVDDEGLKLVNEGLDFKWPWPRQLYGRVVKKLAAEGAEAIGFDILFDQLDEPRPERSVKLSNGKEIPSDEYFAQQLRNAGNVILAVFGETSGARWSAIPPAAMFRTNAWAMAHATSAKDSDGVLRRAHPFKDDPQQGRIWHLGIVMAARALGLDLAKAVVEPRRIVLRGEGGVERVIPLDDEGYFYIDWGIAWNDPRIAKDGIHDLLGLGATNHPDWRGKLVVIGSIGAGNNISDVGASPIEKETYLVSKHWNVANSLLTGRFIRQSPLAIDILLIAAMASLASVITWRLGAPWPSVLVVVVAGAYCVVAAWIYVATRWWIPIVAPVAGGLLMTHVAAVTYQMVFEQRERRRVRGVFSKVVSPDVVNELLKAEKLNLGGARCAITVFFADVRGFTEMTDSTQAKAEEFVRAHKLSPEQAEAYFDAAARETLNTVNLYLAAIADQIKKHLGTLDKYIGDCVMAFWGAPVPNAQHALCCVRAAIDAQRAMFQLNLQRAEENKLREEQNQERVARGEPPVNLLPLLSLGTGINSGTAIVGLMGSENTFLNYTVFGREVNLASRLEGVSGRGRIIISEATHADLRRDDAALAATCVELAPVIPKGFQKPIRIFEVPWKTATTDTAQLVKPA